MCTSLLGRVRVNWGRGHLNKVPTSAHASTWTCNLKRRKRDLTDWMCPVHPIGGAFHCAQTRLKFGRVDRQECTIAFDASAPLKGGLWPAFNPDNATCSIHSEHKTLQVGTLGMEYIHGVVGRLVQPMQDANVPSRLDGSGDQRIGEQGIVDGLAA